MFLELKRVKSMSEKEESEEKELVKVESLSPSSKEVYVVVKIVSKGETREVPGRGGYSTNKVADALVGDETASVYLTLWNENIEEISEGDTLNINNGYVKLLRGNMRLNIGKYGSYEVLSESPIEEVNIENNLSDKRYEQERRYSSYRPRYGQRRGYQQRGRY